MRLHHEETAHTHTAPNKQPDKQQLRQRPRADKPFACRFGRTDLMTKKETASQSIRPEEIMRRSLALQC